MSIIAHGKRKIKRGIRTFNLPDLNGRVPWYDSTATIGTTSNGGLPNLYGTTRYSANGSNNYFGGWVQNTGVFTADTTESTSGMGGGSSHRGAKRLIFDASRVSSVYDSGTTVRPAVVYTNWCIKF